MSTARLTGSLVCCVLLAACPHDFARSIYDVDAAADAEALADLPLPDARNPVDLYPHPDTRCTPPCVESLPQTVSLPGGVVVAADGTIYVAETGYNRIRVIADGKISTLAGTGQGLTDGPLDQAQFNYPKGLALGADGTLYVADHGNHAIRTIAGGQVDTLAGDGTSGYVDGPAAQARFYGPMAVAVDSTAKVYVADSSNNVVRTIAGGQVSTLAGDGTPSHLDGAAKSARFYWPRGVVVDSDGAVYVGDSSNNRIRVIKSGTVDTVAGTGSQGLVDGDPASARFHTPSGLALGPNSALYVADTTNHAVRLVKGGQVTTLAGDGFPGLTDGPTTQAELNGPVGLAVGEDGRIYVADTDNNRIRVIYP